MEALNYTQLASVVLALSVAFGKVLMTSEFGILGLS